MSDLDWRPAERADSAAIAVVYNAVAERFGSRDTWTVSRLEEEFDRPTWDPATDSRVAIQGDSIVAVGAVVPPPQEGHRSWLVGAVHPAQRGVGIGRELFGWQLDRLAEMRMARGADREWTALAGMHAEDDSAARLFRRRGLEVDRQFCIMERPVKGTLVDAPLPAGLRAVPFSADLERALYATHQEAFSDHYGYQGRPFDHWVSMVRGQDFRPELSRLAVTEDGEVAGFVLSSIDADPQRMWLQSIGTRRAWRGKGVASGLIASTLQGYADAGLETAVLDVDSINPTGALRVYERMGFAEIERSVVYSCPIR